MVITDVRKRTAQLIEEHKAATFALAPKRKPRGRPFPKGNKIGHRWKKGESGNPSGLPGTDLAALYARRLFERHPETAEGFRALGEELKGFNAYGFAVLADRGYGKVRERQLTEHTGAHGRPVNLIVKLEPNHAKRSD